jgi:hypothetical protein
MEEEGSNGHGGGSGLDVNADVGWACPPRSPARTMFQMRSDAQELGRPTSTSF